MKNTKIIGTRSKANLSIAICFLGLLLLFMSIIALIFFLLIRDHYFILLLVEIIVLVNFGGLGSVFLIVHFTTSKNLITVDKKGIYVNHKKEFIPYQNIIDISINKMSTYLRLPSNQIVIHTLEKDITIDYVRNVESTVRKINIIRANN